MRITGLIILIAILFSGCQNNVTNNSSSSEAEKIQVVQQGLMSGRVYSIGSTAVTNDWSPPPLEGISIIVVLGQDKEPIYETSTDAEGRFSLSLNPGEYFLAVKTSPEQPLPFIIQPITGPFLVKENGLCSSYAYFDNGIR